jgi:hypothetical protein
MANGGFQAAGGMLTGLLAVACGWMGENHHIGFTVASRFSWGMRGAYCELTRKKRERERKMDWIDLIWMQSPS